MKVHQCFHPLARLVLVESTVALARALAAAPMKRSSKFCPATVEFENCEEAVMWFIIGEIFRETSVIENINHVINYPRLYYVSL